MDPRLTIGIGAGLGLVSSALIQLTNINRLLLLGVLGLGLAILVRELAPWVAAKMGGTTGRRRKMIPIVVMVCGVIAFGMGAVWYYVENPVRHKEIVPLGPGGKGGNAAVTGRNSGAEGGTGGQGGIGPGGPGGDAAVLGDNSFARGGDGGNAAQPDGRGGKRTFGPAQRMDLPTSLWKYGYGCHGADAPEYTRRINLLRKIRAEFIQEFPDDVAYIDAGVDTVPIEWVNKRLEEMGETWRIEMSDGGYVLPPLSHHE
jgi:hypothetical protein